ncbi:MAG: WYL domain-containing protein [Bacteroidetes bacterium]|nr:WYL domain-containing protein [Bacteroidota bacterium]
MSLNKDAFARYRLIDERMRKKPDPRLEDLIKYVSEHLDKPVSRRTIQLDIQEMRYSQALKFMAPIVFDRGAHSYRYSDATYSINNLPVTADDLHGLEFAISLLDQFKELPAIKEFEEAIMKIAETVRFNKQSRGEDKIIQFDRPNSYRGIEYFEPLVRAIRERRRVKLSYRKFDDEKAKEHIIEPYVLRESKGRFYLLGNVNEGKIAKVKTYAFDRFAGLQVTDKTFDGKAFDSEKYFQNVYGISEGAGKAETVVLAFTPVQAKYIQSQPLHHSQQVVRETKTETHISLSVMVNHELVSQLLSYGANVRVLRPASLAEKVKDELKKSLSQYP